MRTPTRTAPRPPRRNPIPTSHRPRTRPHDPRPCRPPPGQHPRTIRAAQPPRPQPHLDLINRRAYREHSASKRTQTALPIARPKDHGRAVAYTNVLTMASHTNKSNPNGSPSTTSTPSTTPNHHLVLTHSGG
jgi:hypothetical protein